MRGKHRRAIARAAALGAGRRIYGAAKRRRQAQPPAPKPEGQTCPYAKAAKAALIGLGAGAGAALGAAVLRAALTPRKRSE